MYDLLKIFSKNYNDFSKVTTDSDNNIIAVGFTYNGSNWDAYIVKLTSDGSLLWQKKLDSGDHDEFHNVTIDSDNNIIIAGRIDDKACIVKLPSDPNSTNFEDKHTLTDADLTFSNALLTVSSYDEVYTNN